MKLVTFASAVLVILTVLQALSPSAFPFLPLGGSAIAEMGIVLGSAIAFDTVWRLFWKEERK